MLHLKDAHVLFSGKFTNALTVQIDFHSSWESAAEYFEQLRKKLCHSVHKHVRPYPNILKALKAVKGDEEGWYGSSMAHLCFKYDSSMLQLLCHMMPTLRLIQSQIFQTTKSMRQIWHSQKQPSIF